MNKLAAPSRFMSSGLFALLAVGTAASSVACSKPEEEKKQAWSCVRDEVPQGEVIRCTSQAATADGPVASDTPSDGATSDGATSDGATEGATVFECPGSPECPDDAAVGTADAPGGGGGATSESDDAANGTTNGGTVDGASSSGGGGTSGSDDSTKGTTNGGTVDGTKGNGGAAGGGHSGGGGSSHKPGPDECSYMPDLEYCAGPNGSNGAASDGTSSGGTSSGGVDCTKSNCDAPGQEKKGTTDGTGASSGGPPSGGPPSGNASSGGASSSGGPKDKGGKHFKCTKDKKGNKTCVSTPDCASGSHPSACGACVSDSEGESDCVPPTEGGCWVTGGGFIEGASLVPAAAADGHDNFGGNAKPMKKGSVSGHWNHVDHGTGNHAKGRPEYIMCRTTDGPGPGQPGGKKGLVANQVYFGGHAQWRDAATATWSDGYWFDVVAEDHGEPGNTRALKGGQMPDSYHFTIRKIDDTGTNASGTVVYETRGDLAGGNIQLHPSNNGHPALSSPLPAWVSIEQ